MRNNDSPITKIYEAGEETEEEEALQYFHILEHHNELNVIIEEKNQTSIKIFSKSWHTIIKFMKV